MTAGVALAKEMPYLSYSSYKRSSRLLKLFWAKQRNLKKMTIAQKIAEKTHCSTKRVLQDVLPFIRLIYKSGKSIEDLGLNDDEVEWLRK